MSLGARGSQLTRPFRFSIARLPRPFLTAKELGGRFPLFSIVTVPESCVLGHGIPEGVTDWDCLFNVVGGERVNLIVEIIHPCTAELQVDCVSDFYSTISLTHCLFLLFVIVISSVASTRFDGSASRR